MLQLWRAGTLGRGMSRAYEADPSVSSSASHSEASMYTDLSLGALQHGEMPPIRDLAPEMGEVGTGAVLPRSTRVLL